MTSMSPRLPSPPPAAEIQIGPKSPGLGTSDDQESQQMEQTLLNANAKRRIHPGTKSADMAAGPPLVPLNELDSAFQLQEHLAALHYQHTAHNTQPVSREMATLLATPPPQIDKNLWLYELCRFLIAQCNSLIVGFLFDTPPCSYNTCPEMRASEWQFLCAVHETPKSCCAIDYCCHTLDWAANVVTNPKLFPSRFVALSGGDGGAGHDKNAAVKNLVNVFRRLHRIFAHAWFQHRGVFWSVEGQTGLYVLFKTVCDMYDTLSAENYKLPPEAEGLDGAVAAAENMERGPKREHLQLPGPIIQQRSEDDNFLPPGRTNTRRHIRSSPSTGSAVTTVMEADEDDGTDMTSRLSEMRISAPEVVEEGPEVAEVPVIVEQGMMDDAKASFASRREDAGRQPEVTTEEIPEEASASGHETESKEDSTETEREREPDKEDSEKVEESEMPVDESQIDGQNDEAPRSEDAKEAEKVREEAEDKAAIPIPIETDQTSGATDLEKSKSVKEEAEEETKKQEGQATETSPVAEGGQGHESSKNDSKDEDPSDEPKTEDT